MITFEIKFNCDNAAFEDDNKNIEIARILQDVSYKVLNGEADGYDKFQNVKDSNGNIVGTWRLK